MGSYSVVPWWLWYSTGFHGAELPDVGSAFESAVSESVSASMSALAGSSSSAGGIGGGFSGSGGGGFGGGGGAPLIKERISGKEMHACALKRCIFYKGMCVIRGTLGEGRML